jgi:hypothetical protein
LGLALPPSLFSVFWRYNIESKNLPMNTTITVLITIFLIALESSMVRALPPGWRWPAVAFFVAGGVWFAIWITRKKR